MDKLRDYAGKDGNLSGFETVSRMIERLEKGELTEDAVPLISFLELLRDFKQGHRTTNDLLIFFLIHLENYEAKVRQSELSREVKRRRDLPTRFKVEKEKAAKRHDAITFLDLKQDQELLEEGSNKTRQIDEETVNLARKALKLKAKYPKWTYLQISTKLFGDPSEADRIKKAVQRARKAMRS